MVRQGFKVLLNAETDIEVVGEAADGHEMVELAETLQPDVILADISMPNLNGIEATKVIHKRYPTMPVVIVTIHSNSSYVIRALRNGALGYLVKNDQFQNVILAIRSVAQGVRYLSNQVNEIVIEAAIKGTSADEDLEDRISDREKEILQLIAEGNTNSDIAKKLIISSRTVETHRTNIMKKLGLASQIDILRYAIRHGITPLE